MKNRAWIPLLIIVIGLYAGCGPGGKALVRVSEPTVQPTQVKVLVIPELGLPSPTPTPTATPVPLAPGLARYTVKKGDTWDKLARTFTGSRRKVKQLLGLNGLTMTADLAEGQAVIVPMPKEEKTPPKTVSRKKATSTPTASATPTPAFPLKLNRAFAPGEKLTFNVDWMGISGGEAVMEDREVVSIGGRLCHHIVCTADSSPVFAAIYKVHDVLDSYMDADGLFSWRYEKHLREGGFKADDSFTFDQFRHLAIEKDNTIPIDPEIQDVISSFYYCRTLDLVVGKDVYIKTYSDKKNWELQVKVLRREKVKVPSGEFNCIVVQPILKFQGLFQQKGEVNIWLTDDAHHVPVMVKSKIIIGTIDIVLREATVVDPR